MAPVRCSSRPDRLGNGRGSRAVMHRHSVAEESTRRREGTRRCHHPTKLCLFASQGTVCVCCLLTPIRSAEKNTISNYYPLESSPRPHSLPASVNRNALLVSGYVCNCSLAIHVNFVVSVGGFDVREERCSRRTRRRGFCRPASSCRHTKARDSTRRTGQLISLRLLPVLLGVRGTVIIIENL